MPEYLLVSLWQLILSWLELCLDRAISFEHDGKNVVKYFSEINSIISSIKVLSDVAIHRGLDINDLQIIKDRFKDI